MDKTQLADFLRRRREALQPEDVGLSRGSRRRAEGLRASNILAKSLPNVRSLRDVSVADFEQLACFVGRQNGSLARLHYVFWTAYSVSGIDFENVAGDKPVEQSA